MFCLKVDVYCVGDVVWVNVDVLIEMFVFGCDDSIV